MANLFRCTGGASTPKELFLYKDGNECTSVTGGWTNSCSISSAAIIIQQRTPTFKGFLSNDSHNEYRYVMCTTSGIDTAGYNRLHITFNASKAGESGPVYIYAFALPNGVTSFANSTHTTSIELGYGQTIARDIVLDISSINKNYCIFGLYFDPTKYSIMTANIERAWLEK